jgi:cysteinyl-tRNA synthetase
MTMPVCSLEISLCSSPESRTLRDLLQQGYEPEAIRYLLASTPYRKSLNFTMDGLRSARTAIERLRNFKLRLETDRYPEGASEAMKTRTEQAAQAFIEGMDDDLNTAEALAAVFEYIRDANSAMDSGEFQAGDSDAALQLLQRFDAVFDVLTPTAQTNAILDSEVELLVEERNTAKKAKNFGLADQIREQLLEQGIILEDTKSGVRWKRK